ASSAWTPAAANADSSLGDCRKRRTSRPSPFTRKVPRSSTSEPRTGPIAAQIAASIGSSTDCGEHWERLGFPDRGVQVWSILVDPKNLRTLYAGTSPVAVYRSDDGGDNWRRLSDPRIPDRVRMPFDCRAKQGGRQPEFSLPHGESQGEDRDRTGIIVDYAFVVSDLPTRPGAFFEGWQGIFDDCLTPKSCAG